MAEATKDTKTHDNLNTVKLDSPPPYGTPVAEGSNFYTKKDSHDNVIMNKQTNEPQQFGQVTFKVGKEISQDGYARYEAFASAIKESKSREGMYNVYVPNDTMSLRVNTGMEGDKKVYNTQEFPRDDVVKSHNREQGFINKSAEKAMEKASAMEVQEASAEAKGPEMG